MKGCAMLEIVNYFIFRLHSIKGCTVLEINYFLFRLPSMKGYTVFQTKIMVFENSAWFDRWVPTFWRNLLLSFLRRMKQQAPAKCWYLSAKLHGLSEDCDLNSQCCRNLKSHTGYSSQTDVVWSTLVRGMKCIVIKEFSQEQNERSSNTVCFSREAPLAIQIGLCLLTVPSVDMLHIS
jgi:hypothetical protein